ncbi:MAG TPA: hypothetical protein VM223_10810 [Planctomycetota bacterium]|nr:hypothetical protein [Planctomycetota bacterium]
MLFSEGRAHTDTAIARLLLWAAMPAVLILGGCRAAPAIQPQPDWPDRVVEAGGWSFIRQPHMDRCIWFCLSSDEATWEQLGELAGLDPLEHSFWAQDIDGNPAYETRPFIGKRYTLPNLVYIVMGDSSLPNPLGPVPYLGSGLEWIKAFPESIWAPATRPIGKALIFRPDLPMRDGFKVVTVQNLGMKEVASIFRNPDTWGFVFFGHGNDIGIATKEVIHQEMASSFAIRASQHHLLGKTVLNSCFGQALAEQFTSPTGTSLGHPGFYHPPIGTRNW